MTSLADIDLTKRPVRVTNVATGEEGWAVRYGRPEWGGVRRSIFATRKQAAEADVSDDTGSKMIRRTVIPDAEDWLIVD